MYPPPPVHGDPYDYAPVGAGDPYGYGATAPAPSQLYSHQHRAHSYHLQPPTLNPVPIASSYLSSNYSLASPQRNSSQDELRTLFVAGLPDDTKPREICNLFREFPGYESSSLRINERSSQAYAFVVFSDRHSALTAMHALNGMRFDLERETLLHINLAKSNSRGKRSRGDDDGSQHSTKYFRREEYFGPGSNTHTHGHALHTAHTTFDFPSTLRVSSSEAPAPPETHYNQMCDLNIGSQGNNPPCPTLFVANLGPNCSEDELIHVFSRWPGFMKLKMQSRRESFAAFVDFIDEESASAAMNNLQGTFLHSSSAGGMRLEYAKSRMGLRSKRDQV